MLTVLLGIFGSVTAALIIALLTWIAGSLVAQKIDLARVVAELFPDRSPTMRDRVEHIEETTAVTQAKVDAMKESLDDHRAEAPIERKRAAREVVEELRRHGRVSG